MKAGKGSTVTALLLLTSALDAGR